MVAPARSPDSPLKQLAAQAREEPIVFDNVHPVCEPLAHVILDRMQRDRGRRVVGSINVGGWKSGEDFFTWPDAPVQELRRTIVDLIGAPSPVGWAMVNRGGSYHPRHQHRIAVLFGVFYVAIGDPLTPTLFECPCDGRPARGEIAVDPVLGRLVIARGETWHRVGAYPGELPRITIAFDVRR